MSTNSENNMEAENSERNLACVLFPGIVRNPERAIECLGGIKSISEVNQQTNVKRLGLSYQPENIFMKKMFADSKKTAGVLLKVRVKKKKVDNTVKREVISTTVMGRVGNIFKFEAMCDFQYLPIHNSGLADSKSECVYEKIVPSGLDSVDFLTREAPAPFILPSYFTRADKPCLYRYTDKKSYGIKDHDDTVSTRRKRRILNPPCNFNLIDELPAGPHENIIQKLKARIEAVPKMAADYELTKKKFEERPIWSLNRFAFETKIKKSYLKFILPSIGIYMFDGPWRKLWIRYGFDPRKDPTARFYQTLDFRVRGLGVSKLVNARSTTNYRKADRVWHLAKDSGNVCGEDHVLEGSVIFRPGIILTQRQVYYQYIDIKLPEVEELLSTKPPPGYLCHATRGWLAPNVASACRDHIFRYAKQTLMATHCTDLKFEQASSGDENMDEDEDDDEETSTTTFAGSSVV